MIFTIILGFAALVTAYYVFALLYHWIRYGFLYPMVFLALPVWGIGTALLFLLTLAAYSAI